MQITARRSPWIPAFAGMTLLGAIRFDRHSRESGNPRAT